VRFLLRVLGGSAALLAALCAFVLSGPLMSHALAGHPLAWIGFYLLYALVPAGLWLAAWAVAGRNPFGRRGTDAPPPRRIAAARGALVLAAAAAAFMLAALSLGNLAPGERLRAASLAVVIAASAYSAVMLRRPRFGARTVVIVLGWWAAVALVMGSLAQSRIIDPGAGPARYLAWVVTTGVWLALLAAAGFVATGLPRSVGSALGRKPRWINRLAIHSTGETPSASAAAFSRAWVSSDSSIDCIGTSGARPRAPRRRLRAGSRTRDDPGCGTRESGCPS